jgi:hypothetical protein
MWDTLAPLAICQQFWNRLATLSGDPRLHRADNDDWYEDPPNPQLTFLWLAAISRHPFAYLKHRVLHFNAELALLAPRHYAERIPINHRVYGLPLNVPPFSLPARLFDYAKFNPLSTPAFSLVLGLSMLAFVYRKSTLLPPDVQEAAQCLLLSGVLYSLAFLFVGVSFDARYHIWPMLAVYTGTALCLAGASRPLFPFRAFGYCVTIILLIVFIVTATAQFIQPDAFFPNG